MAAGLRKLWGTSLPLDSNGKPHCNSNLKSQDKVDEGPALPEFDQDQPYR